MSDDKLSDERLRAYAEDNGRTPWESAMARELLALRAEVETVKKRETEGVALFDQLLAEERAKVASLRAEVAKLTKERDLARVEAECHASNHDAVLDEVERLRKLEASLPASLRDAHAEIERLRASQNEVAVRELEAQVASIRAASSRWARERDNATDGHSRDRLDSRIDQLDGTACHIEKRIAALREPATALEKCAPLLARRLHEQAKPAVDVDIESRTDPVPAEPPKRSYTERAKDIADAPHDEPTEWRTLRLLVLLIEMLEARGGAK